LRGESTAPSPRMCMGAAAQLERSTLTDQPLFQLNILADTDREINTKHSSRRSMRTVDNDSCK
jgi:hypothetical protein